MMMNENDVKLNSPRAWLLAARPKTLTGAAVPVIIALALAWADVGHLRLVPAVLCLLFALLMQVDANLINDYFDYLKGADDEQRLGPRRACAQGWVTLPAMRRAICAVTAVACLTGLPLIMFGGWWMVAVGVACVVFCFLYTTHLSYLGLGDVLVLLFFGIVPVCATYYLQTDAVGWVTITASLACGLVIDTLLVVNNYRDRDNDRRTGKVTLVVRIGQRAAEWLFWGLGVAACLLGMVFLTKGYVWATLLPVGYLVLHTHTWRCMKAIAQGRQLNEVLGANARNMLVYGVLVAIGLLIG